MLSADFKNLEEDIKATEKGGAAYLHIDVMDGVFVPSISFGMPVMKSIRSATGQIFDVHLMIIDPIRYIKEFAACGADIITFHLEAAEDPQAVIDEIHKCGCKAGISIKPKTPFEDVAPYMDKVEMLLVMTVEPGFGGQKMMPETLEKVRAARRFVTEKGLRQTSRSTAVSSMTTSTFLWKPVPISSSSVPPFSETTPTERQSASVSTWHSSPEPMINR